MGQKCLHYFNVLKVKDYNKRRWGVKARATSWSWSTHLALISFAFWRELVVPLCLISIAYFLFAPLSQPQLLYLPLDPSDMLIPNRKRTIVKRPPFANLTKPVDNKHRCSAICCAWVQGNCVSYSDSTAIWLLLYACVLVRVCNNFALARIVWHVWFIKYYMH